MNANERAPMRRDEGSALTSFLGDNFSKARLILGSFEKTVSSGNVFEIAASSLISLVKDSADRLKDKGLYSKGT